MYDEKVRDYRDYRIRKLSESDNTLKETIDSFTLDAPAIDSEQLALNRTLPRC